MFKRFLVLELFHGNKDLSSNEWIDVEKELPDAETGLYPVKLSNGTQAEAFFCRDECCKLIQPLNLKPSYWWDRKTGSPLDDVTHWGKS